MTPDIDGRLERARDAQRIALELSLQLSKWIIALTVAAFGGSVALLSNIQGPLQQMYLLQMAWALWALAAGSCLYYFYTVFLATALYARRCSRVTIAVDSGGTVPDPDAMVTAWDRVAFVLAPLALGGGIYLWAMFVLRNL